MRIRSVAVVALLLIAAWVAQSLAQQRTPVAVRWEYATLAFSPPQDPVICVFKSDEKNASAVGSGDINGLMADLYRQLATSGKNDVTVNDLLNWAGSRGWELVTHGDGSYHFKRRK